MEPKEVSPNVNFPQLEEEILKFWKENHIFEKSVESRSPDNPASFYDGPPFVTGVPHYGHLLGSIAKDIIPRYLTMKGKRVRRVWGWDCHGLPIENKVEQKLGLKNRRDIEKIGLLKFIEECQKYVLEISAEWNWYVDRVGRWVDLEHAYKTMDLTYMESVIWAFKQLYDRGLIYKGLRISLFCPRCSTPISNFEIAMDNSYANLEDTAVTLKFKVVDPEFIKKHGLSISKPAYLLAWTTTPWSSVSVMGLAINENFVYQLVEAGDEIYLVAQKRVAEVLGSLEHRVLKELSGKEILGLRYKHLYDYYDQRFQDFKTWPADYVSETEGSGIVTINGAFGDVDMDSAKKYHLPVIVNVDEEGHFTPEVSLAPGVYVKEAEKTLIADWKARNLLFKEEKIIHSYPLCYRCETPLIYRAQDSWFIDIQKIKPQLLEKNQSIHWVPEHFKNGRFTQGLETAPDWGISRTRYWATAMPVWECDQCPNREVFGSIREIEQRSNQKVRDLHRPFIDEIIFTCSRCPGTMKRVKDVLDCWMESGSMPFASRHYPFENKTEFEKSFPADYISEYTGQVRAWFYVLHALSVALFDSPSFQNVVVSGVIMGTDGRKMSKHFNNFPDPRAVIEKYGGDALRLYLMGSPTMAGQDMNISEEGIKEQLRSVLMTLWNCYHFFTTFAGLHGFDPAGSERLTPTDVLDRWILSRANRFLKSFTAYLDDYHIPEAVRSLPEFLDDLSRWYIRRSRKRFRAGDLAALSTLYRVLVLLIKTTAPLIPFVTEKIYRELAGKKESVHLEDWPEIQTDLIDEKLEEQMRISQGLVAEALAERKKLGIKVRQPLSSLTINQSLGAEFLEIIKEEVNVKEVLIGGKTALNAELTPRLREEGLRRDFIRSVQARRKKFGLRPQDEITIFYQAPDAIQKILRENKEMICREVIARDLVLREEEDFADERETAKKEERFLLKIEKT